MDSGMIDKGSSMSIDSGYEQFITNKIAEAPARGFDLAAPTHRSIWAPSCHPCWR